MTAIFAEKALLPNGWFSNVRLVTGADGCIASVKEETGMVPGDTKLEVAVPAMPNLHSHAFQRAMAGMAEFRAHESDSFWSWREVMYTFARTLDPVSFQAIATQLYSEMLAAGYGSVAEFHYLHHLGEGWQEEDAIETSLALIESARATGIGMTLCPVLYQQGGFGDTPLGEKQRRFYHGVDSYCKLLETLNSKCRDLPNVTLGLTFHSLRAVGPDAMREVLQFWQRLAPEGPIHIHIAEQQAEVAACLEWCGKRPVRWLMDHIGIDARWCLIHATHLSEDETRDLAKSGATAGLCPTTEANLGDGFFDLLEFQKEGGIWGIGSDSHISVSPVEELRWLEYGQRLRFQRRNLAASAEAPHSGAELWRRALEGGSRALGRQRWGLQAGANADLLSLDVNHPLLFGHEGDRLMDAWIFSGNQPLVDRVMAGGCWVAENGVHQNRDAIADAYRRTSAQWQRHHLGGEP